MPGSASDTHTLQHVCLQHSNRLAYILRGTRADVVGHNLIYDHSSVLTTRSPRLLCSSPATLTTGPQATVHADYSWRSSVPWTVGGFNIPRCSTHKSSQPDDATWMVASYIPESSNDVIVFLMIFVHSSSCSSLITRGGANLMMSPCVGLASSPLSLNRRHTS